MDSTKFPGYVVGTKRYTLVTPDTPSKVSGNAIFLKDGQSEDRYLVSDMTITVEKETVECHGYRRLATGKYSTRKTHFVVDVMDLSETVLATFALAMIWPSHDD